ncbi:50S ribosomal protein L6 [Fusibacter tunisiensis]|uniref:Large ribosomal subunit protein uL6 n=1 Tax=Fusibacter tunisiensis TaxID=1008308 RepID=A0ABS2MQY6_9FIRM|nr:50S ribosomal protein L6 [Fusibacter tunisiensis]MBM7561810.1 large subunit ribosomal protein L6 [Fusibacter tunisiensis]
MSRVGKLPITIPQGVQVNVSDKNLVTVKGPLGELSEQIDKDIKIEIDGETLSVTRPSDNKRHRALHGLSRALINNMVVGVTNGFERKLQIVGVGYRAAKNGKKLELSLGHSHPVVMEDPDGIETLVPTQTEIVVKGINKQLVGNYASKIREWRKPEPYKGKGVRYSDERVIRKEGKTGKKK